MKNVRFVVSILISLAFCGLAARGVDWRSLLKVLAGVRPGPLSLSFVLVALGLVARAYRWQLLFYPLSGIRRTRLFNVLSLGAAVNMVLPFRLGDVLKAFLFADLEHLDNARVLSTVAVERVADTLAVLVLLLVTIPFIALPSMLVRPILLVGSVAILSATALVFIGARQRASLAAFEAFLRRVHFPARERLHSMIAGGLAGLAALGSWRVAIGTLVWSLAIWTSAALQFHVMTWALDLSTPFTAALTVLTFTSLGMVVPSSPGYVGVLEYLIVVSLGLFAVDKDIALGYALLVRAFGYVSLAVLALVALWSEGMSYTRLRDVVQDVARGSP